MTAQPVRSDQQVQDAVRYLFDGCAPERISEINALWQSLQPRFFLTPDTHDGQRLILDAGCYREVRFNHRVLRSFWLAAFIAWEGYVAVHAQVINGGDPQTTDLGRFKELLIVFDAIVTSTRPDLEPLPNQIPEPGSYPGRDHPDQQAPAEFATIAAGWALLHEARHIQHQQNGTGSSANAAAKEQHDEELSCDEFATRFLIDRHGDYAKDMAVDPNAILRKRRLGIYCALFAMALLSKDRWAASRSHPALQDRFDAVLSIIGQSETDCADAIAHAAFSALRSLWPGVPMPRTTHQGSL